MFNNCIWVSSLCLPLCKKTQNQALYCPTLYVILLILVTFCFVLYSENHVLLCACALFSLPLPWRALFMSRAEVLIKGFACSQQGGKCKTHSTIEVGIHAPWWFLAEHVFSPEPSGTVPSSLKRLHYWSWPAKPSACRCGSSQQLHQQKAPPPTFPSETLHCKGPIQHLAALFCQVHWQKKEWPLGWSLQGHHRIKEQLLRLSKSSQISQACRAFQSSWFMSLAVLMLMRGSFIWLLPELEHIET